MSSYRRGAVLGLTVAETFILLTFLLLIALLGLVLEDEPVSEHDLSGVRGLDLAHEPFAGDGPAVWVRSPQEIETLISELQQARADKEEAERSLADAMHGRDQAQQTARREHEARKEAERGLAAAERARTRAQQAARKEREARREAERGLAAAEHARDRARHNLALLRRKGENPPCWYRVVSAGEGKTREKPYYLFNAAIYEHSIELAPRTPPPGGAADDGGGPYADEWKQLRIDDLPYGRKLSDADFAKAVSGVVAQGRNRRVRSYECVFSVMVWDKTPDHAKRRWKDAHDRIIEGSFSAYTVRDLEWKSAGAGKGG